MSAVSEQFKRFAAKRPPRWRLALWCFLIAGSILIFPVTVRTEQGLTCLQCRATRSIKTFLDHKSDTTTENAFTLWHKQKRAEHEHVWERTGPQFRLNLFGFPTRHSCGIYHPIGNLPPAWELEFVQTAKAEDVAAFFAGILSTNRNEQRVAVNAVFEPMWQRHIQAKR